MKHYIRLNKDGFISKAFSDAFEQPIKDDILVKEGGRHYHLLDMYSDEGVLQLKYIDEKITKVTVVNPVIEETVVLKKTEYDILMGNVIKVATIETDLLKAKEDIVSIKTVDTLTKAL